MQLLAVCVIMENKTYRKNIRAYVADRTNIEDAMKSGNILVNPRSTVKNDVLKLYKKAL